MITSCEILSEKTYFLSSSPCISETRRRRFPPCAYCSFNTFFPPFSFKTPRPSEIHAMSSCYTSWVRSPSKLLIYPPWFTNASPSSSLASSPAPSLQTLTGTSHPHGRPGDPASHSSHLFLRPTLASLSHIHSLHLVIIANYPTTKQKKPSITFRSLPSGSLRQVFIFTSTSDHGSDHIFTTRRPPTVLTPFRGHAVAEAQHLLPCQP